MKQNYIYRIISQFFNNSYLPSIDEKVQKWIIDNTWTIEKDNALKTVWDTIQTKPNENTNTSLSKVKNTIQLIEYKQNHSRKTGVWLSYAAIFVPAILLLGSYFYINREPKMIEVLTSNNEQKECVLSDGTTIFLNSGSKIIYPSKFEETKRIVTLEGEAYFIVARNPTKPFIVQTHLLSVKVLGTKFNVSAYPIDDKASTTLNSGSVQVNIKKGDNDEPYILEPNQQIIYNKIDKSVSITKTTDERAGWKEGFLIFQEATFNDIMNTLQRRFNVSIKYDKQNFTNEPYTIKFINNENVVNILNVLQEITGNFNYKIEGKDVFIYNQKK